MFKTIAISITLFIVSAAASAQVYVGGGIGEASADIAVTNYGPGVMYSVSDTDTAFKFFGGYEFNEYIAVEGGYVDFGNFGVTYADLVDTLSEQYETSALYVAGVASLPLGQVSLYGKLGLAWWEVDASVTSTFGFPLSAEADGIDPVFGMGIQFNAHRNFAFRGEFERYIDVGDYNMTGQSDIDVFSINAIYRF